MVKIAIIKENSCEYDDIGEYVLPLLYKPHTKQQRSNLKGKINEYLHPIVSPFVQIADVEGDDMIETICGLMAKDYPEKKLDEFYYNTEPSYTFPSGYFELIYCKPLFEHESLKQNNIGCYFSLNHTVVTGTCVVICYEYDLSMPKYVKQKSIGINDIVKIIRRRYYSSAILLGDNVLTKYYFQNQTYLLMQVYGSEADDNIHKLSSFLLKYNLVYYSNQDMDSYVNSTATRMNGLHRMYGDVLLFCEMDSDVYGSLTMKDVRRLNLLSYGPLSTRDLRSDEVNDYSNHVHGTDKKVSLWSKYTVVMKRMSERKGFSCMMCEKDISKNVLCPGCFRGVYCSKECMEKHTDHKKGCTYM